MPNPTKYNGKLVSFAKILRNNMTPEEKHLWYDFLRSYIPNVKRQQVMGQYIIDFYCAKAKLAIEIDGIQHDMDENMKKDAIRTEYIEQFGIEVLRIPNKLVNSKFEVICNYIDDTIKQRLKSLISLEQQ